jgi:hypothetical protein
MIQPGLKLLLLNRHLLKTVIRGSQLWITEGPSGEPGKPASRQAGWVAQARKRSGDEDPISGTLCERSAV